MKLFCRLLGHTWVDVFEDPPISWNTDKDGVELKPTVQGEVHSYQRCVRCAERRELVGGADSAGNRT